MLLSQAQSYVFAADINVKGAHISSLPLRLNYISLALLMQVPSHVVIWEVYSVVVYYLSLTHSYTTLAAYCLGWREAMVIRLRMQI